MGGNGADGQWGLGGDRRVLKRVCGEMHSSVPLHKLIRLCTGRERISQCVNYTLKHLENECISPRMLCRDSHWKAIAFERASGIALDAA